MSICKSLALSAICLFLLIGFTDPVLAQSAAFELRSPAPNTAGNRIDMTCFPPPPPPGGEPGIGPPPPCLLPTDLDPDLVAPNPSGFAKYQALSNGKHRIVINLEGLDPDLVLTAWVSYFFPGGPVAPHPIFDPIGPGLPPIAGVSAPVAPTTAAFTEGLGPEPNQFHIRPNGKSQLIIDLDYNPLLPGQGPLRNGMSNTIQALAPDGSDSEQPLCCPNGVPAPEYQPVGSSYLRAFDLNTGFQELDHNGRPVLIRSPRAVDFIALVIHTDKTTHGINPGVPILPIPGLSATTGDHYLLGIIDMRSLHPGNEAVSGELAGDPAQLNDEYALSGVYPNPFNPSTTFQLRVKETQHVRIEVYDMLGRFVAQVHNGELGGEQAHLFTFDASSLASGRYLLRAVGERFVVDQNITLIK
ncbi:MAG: T9SS type A sorting domain-containing protein [Bacteroidota bacterium]